jgi:hypothetical protein
MGPGTIIDDSRVYTLVWDTQLEDMRAGDLRKAMKDKLCVFKFCVFLFVLSEMEGRRSGSITWKWPFCHGSA